MEEKNDVGRPLKFKNVEELQKKIDEYFDNTPDIEITVSGLCLALGTWRSVLMNYEVRPEFKNTIKMAKIRIAQEYEKDLRKKGRSGDIFALKNFGWTDKREIEQTNTNIVKFELGTPPQTKIANIVDAELAEKTGENVGNEDI